MLGARFDAAPSLFDVVWALMKHCLPGEGESTLWECMEQCWHSPNLLESALSDGVIDQVREDDAREVREAAQEIEKVNKEMDDRVRSQ